MPVKNLLIVSVILLAVFSVSFAGCIGSADSVKVGDTVSVFYSLSVDGEQEETNYDGDPLVFKVGSGKVIKGFDEAVVGMEVGDSKNITVPPEKGYGQRNESRIISIPRANINSTADFKVGDSVTFHTSEAGSYISGTITKITDKEIKLDTNPKFAGKTLNFTIKLEKIGE